MEIEGKREIEIRLFLDEATWPPVKAHLIRKFGQKPDSEGGENYARFNTEHRGIEIELILLKGHDAEVNRRLMAYLQSHPQALAEYVAVKRRHAFSRREYYRQKNEFFKRIIESLPDR